MSIYLDRRYPYLKDKDAEKLSAGETGEIVSKTKALMCHKIGDVARLQTDSMIISGFINVTLSGFVDNYNLVLNSIANVVNIIFNSVLSSFGNLFATETKEKQYRIFKVYRFAACWIYGFTAVGFSMLLTPFVGLWLQDTGKTLAFSVVICILIDYYFKGDRIVLSNFKTAAGVFEQDKYLALIQGGVNLVISIVLVQKIGLMGVYIGTIVSGLIANVTKPVYLAAVAANFAVLAGIRTLVMQEVTVASFGVMFVIICVVFNASFLALFGRTEEFGYLWGIVKNRVAGNKK